MATKSKTNTSSLPISPKSTDKLKSTDELEELSDTSDSEESVYSGLEEEESSGAEYESLEEKSSEDDECEEADEDNTKQNVENNNTPNDDIDEYAEDSSDEEDIRNTIGNVPLKWYEEYPHIGYDISGRKIIKPPQGDQIDEFLEKMDNPNYWRTVKDSQTGQDILLSENDIQMIQNIKSGKYPEGTYNPYEPWIDFFTHEKMLHPVTNHPAHKRSFIPSKLEKLKVSHYVNAIKRGWMKPKKEKGDEDDEMEFFDLWKDSEQSEISKRFSHHIPAPKMILPGHEESYNPPPEYLLTKEEEAAWEEKDPENRRVNFLPRKYDSLRLVPSYRRFMNERFSRCLDLYLCPRQRKARMNVNPEDLIPKLPKPKDLQPFPTVQAIIYEGHSDIVRCISVDPSGQWLASGSDDQSVKFWEVTTGRCMKTIKMSGPVKDIVCNPSASFCLVAIIVGSEVVMFNPQVGDKLVSSNTDNMLNSFDGSQDSDLVEWLTYEKHEYDEGFRLKINHPKVVSQVAWHGKGDYFAIVMPQGENKSVFISQLSKRKSQTPFKKSKGLVQKVLFHPTRPFLFVATQIYVRVYNLMKQELTKKLMTNCKWVSSMDVHPGGDNVIIGSYDARLSWFDMDLSTKPYKTLRHHKKALRHICFHKQYPLFASASDDGTIIVCHGRVYNDLMQNPLIVPVKVLRGHDTVKGLSVLSCVFHPTQPWLFSSGADNTIRLYT